MRRQLRLPVLIASLLPLGAGADMEVVTPEGQRVLLKNDHTWEYVQSETVPREQAAVLTVLHVSPRPSACAIGLRLTNNQPFAIKNLVPQFSAYTHDNVLYQTVSVGFNAIKPTRAQYQKLSFSGVTCSEIAYVHVHGGDRCVMGPMTKYASTSEDCLRQVFVDESDMIDIHK
ncbi:MAG: DUF3157 family protein [Chromatiales bacterium]|jgi:hypothetical protein